jgi:hypothetical protein
MHPVRPHSHFLLRQPPLHVKNLLPVSGLAVAASAAFFALSPSPAQAACFGAGNNPCSTFDPTTVSTPGDPLATSGIAKFTSSTVIAGLDYARLNINVVNFSGSPFTLTNFKLTNNQPGFGVINLPNATVSASGFVTGLPWTLVPTLAPGSTFDSIVSKLSFEIPAGVALGTTINVRLQYAADTDANDAQTSSATNVFSTTSSAPAPGPLPLLGAGVAFKFSRKLRRRTMQAV